MVSFAIACAIAMTLAMSSAFAQSNETQSPLSASSQTAGPSQTVNPAHVGHHQPTVKDLPPEVQQSRAAVSPAERELDKRLNICRGC